MKLLMRVWQLFQRPQQEWQKIAEESVTGPQFFVMTIIPLTGFFLVFALAGSMLMMQVFSSASSETGGFQRLFLGALRDYCLSLVYIHIIARLLQNISARCGGSADLVASMKLVIYSILPFLMVKALHFLPILRSDNIGNSIIAIILSNLLASFYSVYLLYLGGPAVLQLSSSKAYAFTVGSSLILLAFAWVPVMIFGLIYVPVLLHG